MHAVDSGFAIEAAGGCDSSADVDDEDISFSARWALGENEGRGRTTLASSRLFNVGEHLFHVRGRGASHYSTSARRDFDASASLSVLL